MREIKFKAWSKTDKYMTAPMSLSFLWEQASGTLTGSPIDYDWLQYTGLKDKNNQEIYGGDILRTSDPLGRECIGVISWEESTFWIKTKTGSLHLSIEEYLEVIGNIYENPELLETSHD